jgi:hypothetical protein
VVTDDCLRNDAGVSDGDVEGRSGWYVLGVNKAIISSWGSGLRENTLLPSMLPTWTQLSLNSTLSWYREATTHHTSL